jgi:hypothetical protein
VGSARLLPRSCAIFAVYVAALAGFTVAIVADDELGTVGGVNGQVFSFAVARTRTIGAMIAWIGMGNARPGICNFGRRCIPGVVKRDAVDRDHPHDRVHPN